MDGYGTSLSSGSAVWVLISVLVGVTIVILLRKRKSKNLDSPGSVTDVTLEIEK